MGNHQKTDLKFRLKLLQKIQHLLFQCDIQSAERLVKDNVLGLGGQSAGNTQPFLLSTGEFIRPMTECVPFQPRHVQQFKAPLFSLLRPHVEQQPQGLLQNGHNALVGV